MAKERVLRVEVNGVELSYLQEGSGTLVLLLHGFPDTARTWKRVLSFLAGKNFRAVAPFQRGYFPSQIPADGDYSIRRLAEDALELIDRLGATKAVMIGHDWGALAAYAAAALAPAKVAAIVTLAIPPFFVLEDSEECGPTMSISDEAKSLPPRCRRMTLPRSITFTHFGAQIGKAQENTLEG